MEELEQLREECLATEETLARVPADRWEGPGLGKWSLAELGAHLVRGVTRIDEYLDAPVEGNAAVCDRVTYWQFDLNAEAPAIAARARAEAAAIDPRTIPERFAAGWRRSLERATVHSPDRLIATIRGPMALGEYAATRVLEVVVHHLDVRRALDLPPAVTPAAGREVTRTLEALLRGPRPRNLGRDRFILTATGRLPSDDDRFPVLR